MSELFLLQSSSASSSSSLGGALTGTVNEPVHVLGIHVHAHVSVLDEGTLESVLPLLIFFIAAGDSLCSNSLSID